MSIKLESCRPVGCIHTYSNHDSIVNKVTCLLCMPCVPLGNMNIIVHYWALSTWKLPIDYVSNLNTLVGLVLDDVFMYYIKLTKLVSKDSIEMKYCPLKYYKLRYMICSVLGLVGVVNRACAAATVSCVSTQSTVVGGVSCASAVSQDVWSTCRNGLPKCDLDTYHVTYPCIPMLNFINY